MKSAKRGAKKVAAKKTPAAKKKVAAKKAAPVKKRAAAKKAPAVKKRVAAKKAPAVKKKVAAKKAPAVKKRAVSKKPAAKKAAPPKRAVSKKPAAKKKAVARSPKKGGAASRKASASVGGGPRRGAIAAAKRAPKKKARVVAPAAPRYPFVAVDVREAYSGEIAALLFDLGAIGVEERDDSTLRKGPSTGLVTVVGAFASHEDARAAIKAVKVSRPVLKPRLEEVVGDAWRDAWKEHFAPFALIPGLVIAPPWIPFRREPGTQVLVLEPGRAFGTGLHASTSLVAELLHERATALAGSTVLDVGTGSGILALAALVLGAARAVALDVDEDAVEVAKENAARNQLAARFEARAGSAMHANGRYPVVLANIEARVLLPMAEDLAATVAPGGTLILSGILAGERDAIVKRYEALGMAHRRTATRGEAAGEGWVAIAFQGAVR